MKYLVMLFFLLSSSLSLAAGGMRSAVNFGIAVFYKTESWESQNTTTSATVTDYDLKLGYVMPTGLYFGGIYSGESSKFNVGNEDRASQSGVSLGYFSDNGLFALGHYFLSADYDSGSTKYSPGSGVGIDFGYLSMISQMFYVGVEFSYKSLTYTKIKTASTELSETTKRSLLQPFLHVGFTF